MLTILFVLIVFVTIFVGLLPVIVVIGIRKGPSTEELSEHRVSLPHSSVTWSASKSGDTKTPKSRRLLELPKRAVAALTVHKAR